MKARSRWYRHRDLERLFGLATLTVMGLLFASRYVVDNGLGVTTAVFVAVSMEEVVYRLAIPTLLTLLLSRMMGVRIALMLCLVVSVALFASIPGHQAQLHDGRGWVAFVAFSALMS